VGPLSPRLGKRDQQWPRANGGIRDHFCGPDLRGDRWGHGQTPGGTRGDNLNRWAPARSLPGHAIAHMSGTGGKTTWRTALVNSTAYQYSTSTPLETSGDPSIALETSGDHSIALETSGDHSIAQEIPRKPRTPFDIVGHPSRGASASREVPVQPSRSHCKPRSASAQPLSALNTIP